MKLIKIAIAHTDTTVGAFDSNIRKAKEFALRMAEERCSIGCFQEQLISGYSPEDTIQSPSFAEKQWRVLNDFAAFTASLSYPTVFVLGVTIQWRAHVYNCAAVVGDGRIFGLVPKEKLPTYGVFYERRTCSAGIPNMEERHKGIPLGDLLFEFPFGIMAAEVCEDIWSPDGPLRRRAYSGAEIVCNISASPYRHGVVNTRREILATRAADNEALVVYSSQVGGNDSLVCDGYGEINQNGRCVHLSPRWQEGMSTKVVDLDVTTRLRMQNTTWQTDCEKFLTTSRPTVIIPCELAGWQGFEPLPYPVPDNRSFFLPDKPDKAIAIPREEFFLNSMEAMVWGLAGYVEKTNAFERIIVSLSGGKDSVLSLLIVWEYANRRFANLNSRAKKQAIRDFIGCYSFPTQHNSKTTRSISRQLCRALGVSFTEIGIDENCDLEVASLKATLGDPEKDLKPITLQNIQARARGERMWNISNEQNALFIQTGNMSEKATGYTTVGGDQMGGFSLIGNLPKTVVIALLEFLRDSLHSSLCLPPGARTVLEKLMRTKASAELAKNQYDEEDLMPFEVLDAGMHLAFENKMDREEIEIVLTQMFPEHESQMRGWVEKLVRLFKNSVFKWAFLPPGVHLGRLDLSLEGAQRTAIACSNEWQDQ